MAAEGNASQLVGIVTLLGAAVVAVPLFKRLGLGAVLGYLAAGLAIGPYGLGLVTDAQTILHVAELGVVMFLFIIGLEMRPARLWSLRKEIFGLGAVQVLASALLLTGLAMLVGNGVAGALWAGFGSAATFGTGAVVAADVGALWRDPWRGHFRRDGGAGAAAVRSNGLPRTVTSVASARPTTTASGGWADTDTDSPAARLRCKARAPVASFTCTQDSLRARSTSVPVGASAAGAGALATTAGAEAGAAAVAVAGAAVAAADNAGVATKAGAGAATAGAGAGCEGRSATGASAAPVGTASGAEESTGADAELEATRSSPRGKKYRARAPTSKASTTNPTDREADPFPENDEEVTVDLPTLPLTGALIPALSAARLGLGLWGNKASTGAASTLSTRHTLEARARTNTVSGSTVKLSASRASSLLTGTFSATARAAMCIPDAWRASLSKPPAVNPPLSTTSLIESPAFVSTQLP